MECGGPYVGSVRSLHQLIYKCSKYWKRESESCICWLKVWEFYFPLRLNICVGWCNWLRCAMSTLFSSCYTSYLLLDWWQVLNNFFFSRIVVCVLSSMNSSIENLKTWAYILFASLQNDTHLLHLLHPPFARFYSIVPEIYARLSYRMRDSAL